MGLDTFASCSPDDIELTEEDFKARGCQSRIVRRDFQWGWE